MTGYLARRLLQLIPILLGVSLLVFMLLHFIPGDPARLFAGLEASEEDIAQIRARFGLDRPLHIQYLMFVGGILRADFGNSIRSGRPVLEELVVRYPTTLKLAVVGGVIMVILGLPAGIISALKPNSFFDNVVMVGALFGISTPVFWLGLMLILLFSVILGWFPSGGASSWQHFVLPGFTLGFASTAILARLTRSAMLEVILQDYIRTARSKGLHERVVVFKHALRNALIPIITVVGLQVGYLLGGAVLTETVFTINGMGRFIIQSIQFRDYPIVQNGVLIFALNFVLVNLLVDLTYAVTDPRIRYS